MLCKEAINVKVQNIQHYITCAMNCNYRIAAELYALETQFVSGAQKGVNE